MKVRQTDRLEGTLQIFLVMFLVFVSTARGADIVSSGANSEVFEATGFYMGSDLTVGTSVSAGSLVVQNSGYAYLSNLTVNAMGAVSIYSNSSLYVWDTLTGSGTINWAGGGRLVFEGERWYKSLTVGDGALTLGFLGENTFIDASALITVSSSGYLYSYNNSSAVNYGSSIAVDGGTAVMSGGTLQGGLHGFSSGGIDVQNGCAWYAGDYLKALDAGCAVALSGGTLYSTDVIAGNFSFAEGGVHLQGGAHDTTYFDTSLSLSSKDLYIETGAAVELAETQPSFQDNEHVHVAGGTLTVDGVGAGQIDVVSGTLNITGQNNITHFLDVSGGTVNLSAFAWNPFETLTGGEIHVLTGGTWYAGNELGDIADDAQVVLDGGTLTLYTAFDANDFTWNSGVLSISSCLVSGDLTVNGELDVWSTAISGNLDFNAGSRLSMSASDRFLVEGLAQLNGGTLDISLSGSVTNGAVFDLFDWSGGISGTFDEILINGVAVDEEQWDLSALYTGGSIQSVPEPTTLLLILFGGGIAWLARLKQRF